MKPLRLFSKVYGKKELPTTIPKHEKKELLYLCTKNVLFSFDKQNDMYKLNDGIAMGSLLGPVLVNMFMVELERTIIPSLSDKIKLWKRYVDETIDFLKLKKLRMFCHN